MPWELPPAFTRIVEIYAFIYRHGGRQYLQGVGIFLFSGAVVFYLKLYGMRIYLAAYGVRPWFGHGLVVCFVFDVGALIFLCKKRSQYVYGLIEASLGLWAAYAIATSMRPKKIELSTVSSLIGCCYAVASGMKDLEESSKNADKSMAELEKLIDEEFGQDNSFE